MERSGAFPGRAPPSRAAHPRSVGFRDPQRLAAAFEPIVEEDARDLAALAGALAIAEIEASAKANGILSAIRRDANAIEAFIDEERTGEMAATCFARSSVIVLESPGDESGTPDAALALLDSSLALGTPNKKPAIVPTKNAAPDANHNKQ
jgi:hypothetical protein